MSDVIDTTREHVGFTVSGAPLDVFHLAGHEGTSRLFRYELVCAAPARDASTRALLGRAAHITLFAYGAERHVHGIVAEAMSGFGDDGGALLNLVVRPQVYPLTLGRSCKVFQDMSVVDIARAVLAASPQPTRWEIAEAHPPHIYCAQYREDDWTFVARLLEEEGIYTWFDHEGEQSTLVFCDHSTSAPDIPGGAYLELRYASGMHASREIVEELGVEACAGPTRFVVGSFDPARPRLAVNAATGAGRLEIYDAPGGGPSSPDACGRQAQLMAQTAAAGARGVVGSTTSARLTPGMVVEVAGNPIARLDGRYFLTEVRCEVTQRRGDQAGGDRSLSCRFRGVPASVPYRTAATTPPAKQAGLQTGSVVGPSGAEVYPDASGRVRVQLRWDREGKRDDSAGKWMRVAQRGTAESMLLPRVGWNVLSFNEEGTVDAPSVLSRIHDAEHPPAYPLPANKTRVVWKTATTPGGGSFNEIYFEDNKGAEEMFINASRDMSLLIQHVRKDEVLRDALHEVGRDHHVTAGAAHDDVVRRDQLMSVGHDEVKDVGAGVMNKITGDEVVTIAGRRTIKTGGQHKITVGETRRLAVGAAQIDLTLGQISLTTKSSQVLVGGARAAISAASISEDVGQVSAQVVGVAKLEIAGKNRAIDCKDILIEGVGGAYVLDAGKSFAETADVGSFWTVGAVMSGAAPTLQAEATLRIELRCGSSKIVLLPDSVEISASKYDLSGATLDVRAGVVKHN